MIVTDCAALTKIDSLRVDLVRRFPEREHVIDGCLAAVLAGEHVLLIGPPGGAKSMLVRSIARAFGGTYFERLLTKFSTPDELFGPISLRSLENDCFERVIVGKLPTVEFAFVDEIWKSSSAILNSLLTLMNERLYHNDGPPIECPLVTLFGASNELPESGELDALYDRFLMRFDVQYVTQHDSIRAIFIADEPVPAQFLTMDELRAAQAEVVAVTVSEETVDGLIAIRTACRAEGLVVSDRRWKRSLKMARACAYLAGRDKTSPDDLLVLSDMLWREQKEKDKAARLVHDNADPVMTRVREISTAVTEVSRKFNQTSASAPALKRYTEQRVELQALAARGLQRTQTAIDGVIKNLDAAVSRARRGTPQGVPVPRIIRG